MDGKVGNLRFEWTKRRGFQSSLLRSLPCLTSLGNPHTFLLFPFTHTHTSSLFFYPETTSLLIYSSFSSTFNLTCLFIQIPQETFSVSDNRQNPHNSKRFRRFKSKSRRNHQKDYFFFNVVENNKRARRTLYHAHHHDELWKGFEK